MKKIIPFILFAAFGLIASISSAQKYSLDGIGRFNVRNTGAIVEKNVIKGYFMFYQSEKIDKKNRAFEIVVLDENLKETVSERIIEPKTTYLLEAAYNGAVVMFKFYDSKLGKVHYRALSNAGKLGPKHTREASKLEIGIYNNAVAKDITNVSLNPFGTDMFVDVFEFKDTKGYSFSVQAVDNDGNPKWTYEPDHVKGVDGASYLSADQNNLVLLGTNQKNALSRDITYRVITLSKEGSLAYEAPLETEEFAMMPHNAYFEPESNNLVVIGEYFDASDKAMKAESKGLSVRVFNKSGDDVSQHFISWDKDVLKKVDAENKKDIKKYSIMFHNIVRASDGKVIAIGEQYRKQVSGTGVAMKLAANAMGGSTTASALEIKIGKVIIIELSKEFELSNVKIIDKKPNNVVLSQDYSLANQHLLAKILKAQGDFDYAYTQNNDDNSIITMGYVDMEKVEGGGRKKSVFNAVNYVAADGTYSSDKIVLETDAYFMHVMPGKAGYVMIMEYFRKAKKLALHLEPINL